MKELVSHPRTHSLLERIRSRHGFYIVHGENGIGKKSLLLDRLKDRTVHMLAPEKSTITIEQVREATDWFRLKHAEPHYLIIDDSHALSEQAQNALLKDLETLPENVSVIMITPYPHVLLPTIHSRAQSFYIAPPDREQLLATLKEYGMDDETADNLLTAHGRRPNVLLDEAARETGEAYAADIAQLFVRSLYERLQAAMRLQDKLPNALDDIAGYARSRLRTDPQDWAWAVMACAQAKRLQAANCNKKLILDTIALRGPQW